MYALALVISIFLMPRQITPIMIGTICFIAIGISTFVHWDWVPLWELVPNRFFLCLTIFVLTVVGTYVRRMEREILDGIRRFELIIRDAPVGMLLAKADGTIVMANENTLDIFGYKRHELIGANVNMLTPPEVRKFHADNIKDYATNPTSRKMGAGRELFGAKKDSTLVPVEIGLAPIDTRDDGECVLASIVDISVRKSMREELEQFTYIVSHDLQVPLVSIAGFAQKLKDKCQDILGPTEMHWLERIIVNVGTMENLIRDLLEMSRIQRRDLNLSKIDLNEILTATLELLAPIAEAKGVKIAADKLPICVGNEVRIKQVFENLVGNALKHMGNSVEPTVTITHQEYSDHFEFVVSDNGVGIEKAHHEKIFKIFERLFPEKTNGTGLGLTICRSIIEKHKGRIWVESEVGKGSAFHFTLRKPVEEISK